MSQLTIHLLGTPHIELDNTPITIDRRKVLALLAYLALTQHTHRRDHLATLFWPGYNQTSARANLRRALSMLNKSLGGNWLQSEREQISLKRGENFWLDVDQFHQHLAGCATHSHPASEVCSDCLEPLNQAATLYLDDLLTGFTLPDSPEFDDWQLFQTESLRRELAETLEKLVRGHSAQNEFESAIAFARRWLALDPLEEVAHRHLMRLLTLNGKRNAALAQYNECRQILSDELGVEPTAETTVLYQQIREDKLVTENLAITPPLTSPSTPRHNLPPQLTPFIGREEELTEIGRLIENEPTCHLLTLVGPGGIGKTRLAIQTAADSVDAFTHGVYFIPLAPISATESIIPTIADALNFPLSGSKPKEQLLNYLRQKKMLLALDNFEHLIPDGATDLVSEIVTAAPQIKLLVTSRERLNLQEEWSIEVLGMNVPSGDRAETEALETFDAIQLFTQRAGRTRPGFTLSTENTLDIVAICQLVGGMPLGLELAATWLRMMSSREIRQEIQRNLDFLTTSVRNVPDRHQSLRAVFQHSWQLLSEEEQAVFRKLSVFRGGFRRRAAERVVEASLTHLLALVDKSLLRRTRAGRYEIHELVRQYAAEKLDEIPDEIEQTQDQHSEYYLTFLQQRTDDFKGRRLKEALNEITADIDNIRAGWHRAVTQQNIATLGKSQESLLQFYDYRGWIQEAETAFGQALEQLIEDEENIVHAQLLRGHGWFRCQLGHKQGIELLKQSVSLLRLAEPEPQLELAFSALVLGWATHIWSEFEEATRSIKESLAIYTRVNDQWGIGSAEIELGYFAFYTGKYVDAEQHLQKSISALSQNGKLANLENALMALGRIAQIKGEYEQAGQYLRKSLQIGRGVGFQGFLGTTLRELGYLATAEGNYVQAQEYLQESVDICREIGEQRSLANSLDKMGSVTRLRGDFEQAEQLFQEGLTISKEIDHQWNIALLFNSLGRLVYEQGEYRQAERYHRDSLAIWKKLGNQREIASSLSDLGYAILAVDRTRLAEAGQQFHQALTIATEIGARPVVLNVLVGIATLLSTSESRDSERERAIELLALALHHPASEQETKDRAKQLLDKLAASLPPESVAAAEERGKARDLEISAAELLSEVEKW